MVLRVWLCDPELHKHLAVPDRGSARVPDDDRQCANVSEQAAGIVDVSRSRHSRQVGLMVLFSGQATYFKKRLKEYPGVSEFTGTDFCHMKKAV